jgi:hypothetical protein
MAEIILGQPDNPAPATGGATPGAPAESQDILKLDKFQGKKPEDIARSYLDLEKRFGEQGSEVGDLRTKVNELTGALEILVTQQKAGMTDIQSGGQMPPAAGQAQPQIDWSNPEEATKSILALTRKEAETTVAQNLGIVKQLRGQLAETNAQSGLSEARAIRPDLFQGDKAEKVRQSLRALYVSGQIRNESALRNPLVWLTTASVMKEMETGFRPSGGGAGMAPVPGEMPGSGRMATGGRNIVISKSDNAIDTDTMLKTLGKAAGIKDEADLAKLYEE